MPQSTTKVMGMLNIPKQAEAVSTEASSHDLSISSKDSLPQQPVMLFKPSKEINKQSSKQQQSKEAKEPNRVLDEIDEIFKQFGIDR